MKIKQMIQTLNSFFSGTAGKGYDMLTDEFGIEPKDFSKLSKRRKQELVKDFIKGFKSALGNDVTMFKINDDFEFEIDEALLDWVVEIGEIASILSTLAHHYEVRIEEVKK